MNLIDIAYTAIRFRKKIDEARSLQTLINDQHNALQKLQMYGKKLEAGEKRSPTDRLTDEYGEFFR